MTPYATLDYVKQFMSTELATTATLSGDEQRLLQALRLVSRRIDLLFKSQYPVFAPFKATRAFDVLGSQVNSRLNTFDLGAFLLALDGDVSLAGTVQSVALYGSLPTRTLRLTDSGVSWYHQESCTDAGSAATLLQVSVPGIWGFHRDWANAFVAVDALTADVNASEVTFTVSNVDGEDEYGITPRLSAGALVQMEDEWVEVTSTNPTSTAPTNTFKGRRGVNGSTASAHAISTPVEVYRVEEPVQQAVARQAAMTYTRRGAYNKNEAGGAAGMVSISYPADWLQDVLGMIGAYA